jgi:ABC-type sulfate transport system permease component
MQMIRTAQVGQIAAATLFFLLTALCLGLYVGSTMPSVSLVGLRFIESDFLDSISRYFGGIGIGLILAGSGSLIGMLLQKLLATFSIRAAKNSSQHMLAISFLCLVVGTIVASWYAWSYLHPK